MGRLLNRQPPIWTLKVFFPSIMTRLAGVPTGFPMTRDDVRFVSEFIDSMFPLTPKVAGVNFDAFVSNADVNDYNLEAVKAPTLIIHTEDDPLASHDASKRAVERIPGARFLSLELGGHLMLSQTEIVRNELADFLAQHIELSQMDGMLVGGSR